MELADVQIVRDDAGSRRCSWCKKMAWSPETTPGFVPGGKGMPTSDGGWALLIFPAHPPLGRRVEGVHVACWSIANDAARTEMRLGRAPKRPRTPRVDRGIGPKRNPPEYVMADVSMADVMPRGRSCVCCNNGGSFNEDKVARYQPANITANDRGKVFVIDWPAFGIVGPYADYAHAECWLSLGDTARKSRTRRAVERSALPGPLFAASGEG